jgi:lipid-A-disaccharide synthase
VEINSGHLKYYIIAGEASGDLHASNLIREIKKLNPNATFRAWGGDLMEKEGAHLVKHYRELAFMGFVEVVMNLKTILRNLEFCKKDILDFKPDRLILVDYPGFNMRIAGFAHNAGIKVCYYISPQVWAWKEKRVHQLKKHVDKMLVILPFEKDFYLKYNFEVDFVGHPLLDAIERRLLKDPSDWKRENGIDHRPVIALLPGSRRQEIATMLPLMLSVIPSFKNYQFVIAAAPSIPIEYYRQFTGEYPVIIIEDDTYSVLSVATAALVTSGTATLETALMDVPEVVCYKGNLISYHIARKLIKVKFISLVNLIMDREVVKELIQNELNKRNLIEELGKIAEGVKRDSLLSDYRVLRQKLGGPGASERAARIIAQGNF